MSQPPLRYRVAVHQASFKNKSSNQTELSKLVIDLNEKKEKFQLKYKLIENKLSYNTRSKVCNLCTAEKYILLRQILYYPGKINYISTKYF